MKRVSKLGRLASMVRLEAWLFVALDAKIAEMEDDMFDRLALSVSKGQDFLLQSAHKPDPFQMIVKPVNSAASKGIYLCHSKHEVIGGKGQPIEVMTSWCGTRSINLAFEAVMTRARRQGSRIPKRVLTGNPHFAVERAEKIFGFQIVRLDKNRGICLDRFKAALSESDVAAWKTRTRGALGCLSY